MSIEDEIVNWALGRPAWQQEVLVALAEGNAFDASEISTLADEVLDPAKSTPNKEAKKISLKSSAPQQVQLFELSDTKGVNALADGQTLSIAPTGITVIYGDNGSGKSGYARLIKSLVKARRDAQILPDVFDDAAPAPSADLKFTIAGTDHTLKYPAQPTFETLKMSFYDEHCGDEYLNKQSIISYRPSALTLLDGLIQVCDLISTELKSRQQSNSAKELTLNLPPQTTAGAFAISLSAQTTDDQIDAAVRLPAGTNQLLATTLQEEARLLGSDPSKEQVRLSGAAEDLDKLRAHLKLILDSLGDTALAKVLVLRQKSRVSREAANVAAKTSFDSEPLAGVGASTWRTLWEAARSYSTTYPYHQHEFPYTGEDAYCVLCQQPLNEDAKDRLRRFDSYMQDTTERDAAIAETEYTNSLLTLDRVNVVGGPIPAALVTLAREDAKLENNIQALLEKLDERKIAILDYMRFDAPAPGTFSPIDLPAKIDELATALRDRAANTDVTTFKELLSTLTKKKDELNASIRLSESAILLREEVRRRKEFATLQSARVTTDTKAITQKSSALSRQYATKVILDQFTRETERLRLERVTLEDLGGQKGQLTQKPGLLGAKNREASAKMVLSEGEQTALGLAGFFTEAVFDQTKSAIIFDDPVTSLDHVRRDKVAERLAQLATDRQVVVFTHDVAFTGDLALAAVSEHVSLTERSVERRGARPGVCVTTFPWKAKDFSSRITHMTQELAKLKSDRPDLLQDDYEVRVGAWAGLLSEAWERCAISEIMNQVFDRGSSQVRVMKFRLLAKITEVDNQDYQDGYAHTSKWSRRHDKAPSTNYVAPEPVDLESELNRLIEWQKRIKKYL